MATGIVFMNGKRAGTLSRIGDEYIFRYDDEYYYNSYEKAISVTFPKTRQQYHSGELFPFFFNMLSEGLNRKLQCRLFQIDENDSFSLLLATGGNETIGAVCVLPETKNGR